MPEIRLSTPEKYALVDALCTKLRFLHGYGGTRADHVEVARRLVELCESLPGDSDGA